MSLPTVEHPPASPRPGQRSRWAPFNITATARLLAGWLDRDPTACLLLLTADATEAQHLLDAVTFFQPQAPVHRFPEWEMLPYDRFSPHQEILSERLRQLHTLLTHPRGLLIVTAAALQQPVPPAAFIRRHTLILETGQQLKLEQFVEQLESSGYQRVSQVMEPGEYAVRGGLIDLFPMGSPHPLRIDLLDDEIDTIRTFDPETQLSRTRQTRIELLPGREFTLDRDSIALFRRQARSQFGPEIRTTRLYQDISEGRPVGGLEMYLPLFHEQAATLWDYLPADTLVFTRGDLAGAALDTWRTFQERHELARLNRDFPPLPPERLCLTSEAFMQRLNRFARIDLLEQANDARTTRFDALPVPDLTLRQDHEQPLSRLNAFLDRYPGRTLLIAESPGRREALLTLLQRMPRQPQTVEDWPAFRQSQAAFAITTGPLEQTFIDTHLALITEEALFGHQAVQRRRSRRRTHEDFDTAIRNLAELEVGQPVVHIEHGVGRYRGLETLEVGDRAQEFVVVEYAGGDKLYVPVTTLECLSRYTGASAENAPLHRLGSDRWRKAREKAARQVQDVAAELLDIYARRAAREGTRYHVDPTDYARFAAAFPYEETPDQQAAIEAVLADMQSGRPMDRLICGDVGFGKTEVAMRAAFVAVQNGKQVAVLVPTTLLAQQHYDSFTSRFADWPVRIGLLSRFQSARAQKTTLTELAEGKIDIIIGTHKLLQKDVRFRDLGLVILDEEHRFGVRQKERLKKLRAEVDVLTLTATPIPRTLNMAMHELRSLSIMTTPPPRRLDVETFVQPWNETTVREACLRELRRGGQVYILFNKVEEIDTFADRIRTLVPEGRVEVAHGQMPERQLERVMHDFYHQKFNILVCTTIIETGLDVPTANTILIHRADQFGLAQLHQLRGRVGRAHHRAFAYLFTPEPPARMTPEAERRLEAIARYRSLGAGFLLANHDLEIRGAGELLGDRQAGQIQEIGFNLYQELLERAVAALKAGRTPDLTLEDTLLEVDLGVPALIPEDYLPDVATRLTLYKRIASATDEAACHQLEIEMIDRFGLLPEPVRNLFAVQRIKLRARQLGLKKVEAGEQQARIHFGPNPAVDPVALIRLIQQAPQRYHLKGQERLTVRQPMPTIEDRIKTLNELFDNLEEKSDETT